MVMTDRVAALMDLENSLLDLASQADAEGLADDAAEFRLEAMRVGDEVEDALDAMDAQADHDRASEELAMMGEL